MAGGTEVGVEISVEPASGDDDAEGAAGLETTEPLHPAHRTTRLSSAMTGWRFMPRIVCSWSRIDVVET